MSWVRRNALKPGVKRTDTLLLRQGPGRPTVVAVTAVAAVFVAVGASMYVRVSADQLNSGSTALPVGAQVLSVDGAKFPMDGAFDMTYLPNGNHTIAFQQSDEASAQSHQMLVNNDLGPLVAARNFVFAGMHGNKTAVDTALGWLFLAAGVLLLLAAWLWLKLGRRIKRGRQGV